MRFSDKEREADQILRYFEFDHLPEHLAKISSIFADTAKYTIDTCKRNAERTVALRKLLEAKDAAVRSALD